MRIGIDARMYGYRSRGIGRYIQELVSRLEKIDESNEYVIFLSCENFEEYSPKNKNFKKVLMPWRWYSMAEQIFFPFYLYQHGCDLIHFPHFNVPFLYRSAFVVTIHDLILIRDTQERATTLGSLRYCVKNFFYRRIIKSAVSRAEKIIALTRFGKEDLISAFHLKPDKVEVISQGVSKLLKSTEKMDTNFEFLYNTDTPYVLYVGSAYPHKDLSTLILAMDFVNDHRSMKLVFVGAKDFFYERLLKEYPRSYIRHLADVSDVELVDLYKRAFCLVFPSRYEGFGLPPLEAMRYGCPVIASMSSCIPEVLDDSALYFKKSDVKDLSNRLLELMDDEVLRKKMIQKGFQRVMLYSWESCARETYKLYERSAYKNKINKSK